MTMFIRQSVGIGNIKIGKDPLNFSSYRWICNLLYTNIDKSIVVKRDQYQQHVLAHCIFVLSWNLMCRASNCIGVCLSHLEWKDDALGIYFAHMKNDQAAERPRDPRHVYANPTMPEVCPILSLGVYLLCFSPESDASQLFPGAGQYDRYSKILHRLLAQPELTSELAVRGIDPDQIGTHSVRKGAATFAASGSTACPSSTAVTLRAGWTLGGVQDTYLRYEGAGDQYVGRTVCGLPSDDESFATLPPFFVKDNNEHVIRAVKICFPTLGGAMVRVAQFTLASVVHHCRWLRETLSSGHPLFRTALFTDREMMPTLGKLVACRLGNADDLIRPTGIPPHTALLMRIGNLSRDLQQLVPALNAVAPSVVAGVTHVLEERAIAANTVTKAGLEEVLAQVLERTGVTALVKRMTSPEAAETPVGTLNGEQLLTRPALHMWGGQLHRVPSDFTFPKGTSRIAWQHYCCGDSSKGYPAFRMLEPTDMPNSDLRKRLSDFKSLMMLFRGPLEASGKWIEHPTLDQANAMFDEAEQAAEHLLHDNSKQSKHARRFSQLNWSTMLNLARSKRKKSANSTEEPGADESHESDETS